MLPYGLVLILATSALAAPTAVLDLIPATEYNVEPDNGNPISGNVIDRVLEIYDGGDMPAYTVNAMAVTKLTASNSNPSSQVAAAIQTLAVLGEVIPGNPGDSCDTANLLNAIASGNRAAIRQALRNFAGRIQYYIDVIAQLNAGNSGVRYLTGPRGNCQGGGKEYNFDGVWNVIRNSASPNQQGLIEEQYCAARSLYNSLNSKSTNIGAAYTAASTPIVAEALAPAIPRLIGFLRTVANGGNAVVAGNAAKSAIVNALQRY